MPLAGRTFRVPSHARGHALALGSFVRRGTVLALVLLAACRGDALTDPGSRPAPADPRLTLTGGAGIPIFPDALPGEPQARGDARGLNSSGQVTGSGIDFGGTTLLDYKPYRWTPGSNPVQLIGCCGSEWGNDINDAGVVVGTAQTNALTGNRGFVATGTSMVALPILSGGFEEFSSGAVAVNDAGQIVGVSPASGFVLHAVLWSAAGVIQDLGTLGGSNSAAIDINASGQVIGSSQLAGDAATHFFLWSSGTGMQDLNTLLGAITSVVEINDAGQIVGTYLTAGGQTHAFRYTPGSGLLDLGTLGGTSSAPTGLNNKGDVVGSSPLADGSAHAFLWTAADGMEDVTALTGVPEVRRLNDNLQTLTGTDAPTSLSVTMTRPRLVQLMVTQSNTPPTALFTWSCNGLTCTLDATSSLDDKGVVSYAWDLDKNPGGSATGAVVSVTYPQEGPRTITLTVTDAGGLTDTYTKTIDVSASPIAAFTVSCTGLTCTFDSSGSTDDVGITRRFWWFGDGATSIDVVSPSHTFAQAGTYDVTLEVWDADLTPARITKQVTVTTGAGPVDAPPVAAFSWSCERNRCAFDASASTDDEGIVSYAWDFDRDHGAGKTSGVQVHTTYPKGGTHDVTLTVTDTNGQSSSVTHAVSLP
jgi:probable HAF family extracellular repeat protein